MAKTVYCQVLFGNPTVTGTVTLSFGPTFESATVLVEKPIDGAALQSAFNGGPYGQVIQSAAVDEMIGFCYDRPGSEQLFLRLNGAVIPGVTLSDPAQAGVITRSTQDVSVAAYIAGVATGVAIAV